MSGDIIRRVDVSGHFPTGDSSLTPVGTPPPFRYPPPGIPPPLGPPPRRPCSALCRRSHRLSINPWAVNPSALSLGSALLRHGPLPPTDPSPLWTPTSTDPPHGPPPSGPSLHGPPPTDPPHGPLPPSSRHGHTSCKMHGNCKTECFLPGSAKSSHARCHVHVGMSNSEIHQEISKLCNIKQL